MGIFDDFFGGFFDFNGDGKTTWDEELVAFQIINDIDEELNDEDDSETDFPDNSNNLYNNAAPAEDDDSSDDSEDAYAWREYCYDGSEFGVFPDDYETEDEYYEALSEAIDESS